MFRIPKPEGIPEVTDTGGVIVCRGGEWGHDYPTTCRKCGGPDTYFVKWVKPWIKEEHSEIENFIHDALIDAWDRSAKRFCVSKKEGC